MPDVSDPNPREERLVELHDKVTDALIAALESVDCPAATINAAINHLKANGIEHTHGRKMGKLSSLVQDLPFTEDQGLAAEG